MDEQSRKEKRKSEEEAARSIIWEIFSWIFSFVIALVLALALKNYVIINAEVPTGSMEDTIMPGDRLIGNRLAYLNEGVLRGDIIIFEYPDNEREIYVKRVVGLPGETIDIVDGKIYINGAAEPMSEDYLKEQWTVQTGPYHFEIPEDCYLVLGDNRNDSWDARYWKNCYLREEKILGKALFVYWPFHDFGRLK